MITIELKLDKEFFQFSSFNDWVETAGVKFSDTLEKESLLRSDIICIDCAGRICSYGVHFRRAEEEKTFPVICYKIV